MSLFNFPFFRKSYPSLGNPAFVDDIVAANQLALDGLANLAGLPTFCIISGLQYNAGTYSFGVILLNGQFYLLPAGVTLTEGLYLAPAPQDTNPKPFSDTNARNTYTLNLCAPTSDPTGGGAGATPAFTGNMNNYRYDLNTIKQALIVAQNTIGQLGNAAFRNIGTVTGTVAAGDDQRFGYTIAQANALFAPLSEVLLRGNPGGNNNGFVPSDNYDPATKSYVDSSNPKILARSSGPTVIGDIPSGGVSTTVSFGLTLPSTSYMPVLIIYSNGNAQNDTSTSQTIITSLKLRTGFTIRWQEWFGTTQNISFDWFVLSY
jgi:hypothetical protein